MEVLQRSILFVITTLGRGGAETQVGLLARGLAARGWRVEIATLLAGGALAAGLERDGIRVHELGMPRGVPHPAGIVRLARLVRVTRPTVVHGQMVHANLLARAARCAATMPLLVCTAQNIDEEGWWREVAYRISDRLCDVTTNVSEAATERYRKLGLAAGDRLEYVPNGIDVGRFQPDAAARQRLRQVFGADDGLLWLAVGRLDVQKDPLVLLEAFGRHATRHASSQLIVAGIGPLEEECRARIEALGLHGRIRLLGSRDDVPDLLAAADAFVLASRWEGLPMVILEASAAGLPIVATAAPGTTELVRDGETGFLAPVGDVEALSRQLDRMALLPASARVALGAAARACTTRRYGLDSVLDQWEALYVARLARSGLQLDANHAGD